MTPLGGTFESFLGALAVDLASAALRDLTRTARRNLVGSGRVEALERSCAAGIAAATSCIGSSAELKHLLQDILAKLLDPTEFGPQLQSLLAGKRLDVDMLLERAARLELTLADFPDLDVLRLYEAFEVAFVAVASQEPALAPEIAGQNLVLQSRLQGELLESVRAMEAREPGGAATGALREGYLGKLLDTAGFLTLDGIDPAVATREDKLSRLKLDTTYTGLRVVGSASTERRSVLDFVDQHRRAVILGDPGSGKSTLVNFLALCLAGESLGREKENAKLLLRSAGRAETADDSWVARKPIPVRIVLRDLAASGLLAGKTRGEANQIWEFIEAQLRSSALGDFAGPLRSELLQRGGVILIDGLDEVPEPNRHRASLLEAIEDLAATFKKCRVIVTSRPYAYKNRAWRLGGFVDGALAGFDAEQVAEFSEAWYQSIAPAKGLTREEASSRAHQLAMDVRTNPRLRELAERPLLLTLMASLHAWRGGTLPERRETLYHEAVDLLLDLWEQQRIVLGPGGEPIIQQVSLVQWLKVDHERVRYFLNELARRAHQTQPNLHGTAEVAESDLVHGLYRLSENPETNPAQIGAYLRDRAGLLVSPGEGVYSFPHRTFQEYLAACHLTDENFPDELADLARADPERWREVTLLASAKSTRGSAANAWQLAEALCWKAPGEEGVSSADFWGAFLAGQTLAENLRVQAVPERRRRFMDIIRAWQVAISTGGELPIRERIDAARSLARLGETRRSILEPDDMEFCEVLGGGFLFAGRALSSP